MQATTTSYDQFLKSFQWRDIKSIHYENPKNAFCFICCSKSFLHVHHISYLDISDLKNLITLCHHCHTTLHKEHDLHEIANAHIKMRENYVSGLIFSGKIDQCKTFALKYYLARIKSRSSKNIIKMIIATRERSATPRHKKKLSRSKKRFVLLNKRGYKHHRFSKNNPNPNWTS